MNPQFGLEILAIEINHQSIPLDEMPVEQATWDKREILVRKGVCFFYNVDVQHLESVVRENVVVAPRITSIPHPNFHPLPSSISKRRPQPSIRH